MAVTSRETHFIWKLCYDTLEIHCVNRQIFNPIKESESISVVNIQNVWPSKFGSKPHRLGIIALLVAPNLTQLDYSTEIWHGLYTCYKRSTLLHWCGYVKPLALHLFYLSISDQSVVASLGGFLGLVKWCVPGAQCSAPTCQYFSFIVNRGSFFETLFAKQYTHQICLQLYVQSQ